MISEGPGFASESTCACVRSESGPDRCVDGHARGVSLHAGPRLGASAWLRAAASSTEPVFSAPEDSSTEAERLVPLVRPFVSESIWISTLFRSCAARDDPRRQGQTRARPRRQRASTSSSHAAASARSSSSRRRFRSSAADVIRFFGGARDARDARRCSRRRRHVPKWPRGFPSTTSSCDVEHAIQYVNDETQRLPRRPRD